MKTKDRKEVGGAGDPCECPWRGAGLGSVVVGTHRGSVKGSSSARAGSSARNGVGPGICWLRWCGFLGLSLRTEVHTRKSGSLYHHPEVRHGDSRAGPRAGAVHKPEGTSGMGTPAI